MLLVCIGAGFFPVFLTIGLYKSLISDYDTAAQAFDVLWQGIIGYGMTFLLPCILGIIAAMLFFMERDNNTFKNLRAIPIRSPQLILAKIAAIFVFGIVFCIASTVVTIICGDIAFEIHGILYKLEMSVIIGIFISLGTLPLIILIVFFSKTYIFSILLCIFYSVFNLFACFSIMMLPPVLVKILPTPSITLWAAIDMSRHMSIRDTHDFQKFMDAGIIPSTLEITTILMGIGVISFAIINHLYKKRSQ